MQHAPVPITVWLAPLALLLLPVLAVYLPHALVVVLAVVALVRLGECLRFRLWPCWRNLTFGMGVAVAGWALVSAWWAIQPTQALLGAASLLGLVLVVLFSQDSARALSAAARQWTLTAFLAGTAAAALLLGADVASHGALAGLIHHYDIADPLDQELALRSLNRGASFLSLLCPFLALLAGRLAWRWGRRSALAVLCLTLGVVLLCGKEALALGLIAAILTGALGWFKSVVTRRALATVLVAVVLAAPVAARHIPAPEVIWSQWRHVNQSLLHRLFIWSFTAEHIAAKPVLGWGMNSAKFIPGGSDDIVVGPKTDEARWRPLPLHPHNAVMQWWLELGAVGAGLLALLVVRLISAVGRMTDRAVSAAGLALGANFMVVSLLSFGAWQSWWLASFATGLWLTSLAAAASAGASCSPAIPQELNP